MDILQCLLPRYEGSLLNIKGKGQIYQGEKYTYRNNLKET